MLTRRENRLPVASSRHAPARCKPIIEPLETRTLPSANLIVNGDFELRNARFGSDYKFIHSLLPAGVYDLVADPASSNFYATSYGDHTTGSGLMLGVNGSEMPDQVVWSQPVGVKPGASYRFSVWVSTWYPLFPAVLDFYFNNSLVGTMTAPVQAGVWQQFKVPWQNGASSSVTIRIIDRNTN